MRRVLLLLAVVALPAAIVLFPAFRRALAGRARLFLLVVGGAFVAAAAWRLFLPAGPLPPLTPSERLATAVALALLATSFVLVARDARGK